MTVWRLIAKEIAYRKLSFALGVLSVAMAVGCLVAEVTILRGHDLRTEQIVAAKAAETQARVDQQKQAVEQRVRRLQADVRQRVFELEDDIRKITKGLGFNVLILPEGQDLAEVYSEGFASRTMPESYADKLAASKLVTITHLLPSLTQKVFWPEQKRTIILIGIRGETGGPPAAGSESPGASTTIAVAGDPSSLPGAVDGRAAGDRQGLADPAEPVPASPPRLPKAGDRKPILEPVPPGQVVLGYELHSGLKLQPGDRTRLLGEEFTVGKVHPQRGSVDDITVWINLAQAQKLLKKDGLINAILALECFCSGSAVAKVRQEIAAILPGTQVVEKTTEALARAEARQRAADEAQAALDHAKAEAVAAVQQAVAEGRAAVEAERVGRDRLRGERLLFAVWLVVLVSAGCLVWIVLLSLANVRERTAEIGILRAIGIRAASIFEVFLVKAGAMGLLGACAGLAGGYAVGAAWTQAGAAGGLFDPTLAAAVVVLAPVLAALAAWLPAGSAARRDPAEVLREG